MPQVDDASLVQGAVDEGDNFAGYPLGMGGKSPTGKMRALAVDESGNLFFTPAANALQDVEGAQAVGTTFNTKPFVIAGVDTGGAIRVAPVATFASVNDILSPVATMQRVAADLMIQNATGNATTRVRAINDAIAGVAGGSIPAVGCVVWDGTSFRPALADGSGRVMVGGGAATGAALTGNPLPIAGNDGAGNVAIPKVDLTPAALRVIPGTSTTGVDGASNNSLFGFYNTNAAFCFPGVYQYNYNGATWDRNRTSSDVTLLASASRSTTFTSADIVTYNLTDLTVIIDATAGTGTVTLTVDGKDPASGKYYNILTGTAVTSASTNVYRIMLGLAAVANKDIVAKLPRVIRIVLTSNLVALTYSVGYTLHVGGN